MMRGTISIVRSIVLSTLLVLAGCAMTEQSLRDKGASPLSQGELEALFSRTRTIKWATNTGATGTGTYTKDGVAKLTWTGGGDDGTWRIKDGRFCTKYRTLRNGVVSLKKLGKIMVSSNRAKDL